jgi:hypothetical protein
MSENGIIAPNIECAYWGVKCKNPECQHYILREDLSLQPGALWAFLPSHIRTSTKPANTAGKFICMLAMMSS